MNPLSRLPQCVKPYVGAISFTLGTAIVCGVCLLFDTPLLAAPFAVFWCLTVLVIASAGTGFNGVRPAFQTGHCSRHRFECRLELGCDYCHWEKRKGRNHWRAPGV